MWDWRQLRWLNLWGWWPQVIQNPRKQKLVRFYGFFMYGLDLTTMVAEIVSLYLAVMTGSFKGAIINIVTTTLGAIAAQKIYTILFHHDFITHVIDTIEDLDKRAVLLMGEGSQVKMKSRENRAKMTLVIVVSCLLTIVHYNVRPILIYIIYGERTVAMDMWTPWDEQTSDAGWIFVLAYEWIHIAASMYGMVMFDSLIMSIFEMILAEFDILQIALKKIDFSAEKKDVSLDFCIKFHQDLMKLIARLDEFLIPVHTTQCIMFTLNICFAGFEMMSLSDVSLNKMANLAEVVIAATSLAFCYCYQCHCITEQCTEVIKAACDNNWYEGNLEDQKSLLIFLERAKVPVTFGNIIKFDLGCFISIFKTAFSYYQVLQAFEIS